jgi:hypothetical protein
MAEHSNNQGIDFTVDQNNLYREENITDLKVASIRRLVPVHMDGTRDESRTEQFVGSAQLMAPDGPIPLQAMLPANSFEEALEVFPRAMEQAMAQMIEQLKKLHEMKEAQKRQSDSRIILPGK